MDIGLHTSASEGAPDPLVGARPQPQLEHECGHGHGHEHEHEHENCSNGNATLGHKGQVPPQVDKHAGDAASASSAVAGDVELQHRKAALLQQVSVPSYTFPSCWRL